MHLLKVKLIKNILFLMGTIILCSILYLYHKNNHDYQLAQDIGFTHFKESEVEAIFDRGEIFSFHKTEQLNSVFNSVLVAGEHAYLGADIFSRIALRRSSDGVAIRLGETQHCDRALILDNDRIVCDLELHKKLRESLKSIIYPDLE